jgi:hypothetical protein
MPIVVRMKVILSPPGLILKEDGKRFHTDAGLRQVTVIPASMAPIAKDRLPFLADPVITDRFAEPSAPHSLPGGSPKHGERRLDASWHNG